MSFEGCNHAGHLDAPLRVVFNDNGMSIAPNVGGLSKAACVRPYFEVLGFQYLGPVDGHDLEGLLTAMIELREASGPTVLHIRTHKGRGYAPAEADPYGWHATAPFDAASGVRKSGAAATASWTASFADVLSRLAERDPRILGITAAMPDGTGLDLFQRRHPGRVYDVGIAEQHAVTFAAGLATEGMRPVCAIYSTFLQRAFDQIVHDVALQKLPVLFALDRAGLIGPDGPTHHGVLDFAYLRPIPNMVIAAPRDENELQHLLATGLAHDGPFAVRFPRGSAPGTTLDPEPKLIQIGRAEVLRKGRDVALIGVGKTVRVALDASNALASAGIEATVIDARFVKPLDVRTIVAAARRCGRVITIEDHVAVGGFGSAVLELLAAEAPETHAHVLGLPDSFVDHGDVDQQWRDAGIDAESVADLTRRCVRDAAHRPRKRVRARGGSKRGLTSWQRTKISR
jgi:Deoxyxylulose-5-phosphate synthase